MKTLKLDLYSDVVCPWCLILDHKLDKVIAEQFADAAIEVVQHPVLLMPDTPAGGRRIADVLKARYNVDDLNVVWERPHADARASGLPLDLRNQPFVYPTIDAHTVIRLAGDKAHEVASAITKAYFMGARDISDAAVLVGIATAHGLDAATVKAWLADPEQRAITQREAAAASKAGVRGVPHLLANGRVVAGRSEAELAAVLRSALAD